MSTTDGPKAILMIHYYTMSDNSKVDFSEIQFYENCVFTYIRVPLNFSHVGIEIKASASTRAPYSTLLLIYSIAFSELFNEHGCHRHTNQFYMASVN